MGKPGLEGAPTTTGQRRDERLRRPRESPRHRPRDEARGRERATSIVRDRQLQTCYIIYTYIHIHLYLYLYLYICICICICICINNWLVLYLWFYQAYENSSCVHNSFFKSSTNPKIRTFLLQHYHKTQPRALKFSQELVDGFKQHIKNMFNKFSSYWFICIYIYVYIYIYMNPITLSTRNIYYFKRTYKCIYIYIYIYNYIYIYIYIYI